LDTFDAGRTKGPPRRTPGNHLGSPDAGHTIDEADPLGLITNGLITNALKHAFDGPGNIRVEFRAGAGVRESMLAVIDDGRGMRPARPGSFGTSLIEALAAQVRGRVVLERPGPGTAVRLFFPPTG
jgi:two-component sensor histidine kinase